MTEIDHLVIYIFMALGFGVVLIRLRGIIRKLDLVLRKLNNQQPDNEGGY